MFFWDSKLTTYYDKGKRAYGIGDEIPSRVVHQMGKETFDEYVEKGLIAIEGKEATGAERDLLIEKAEKLGIKPHYKAGIPKIKAMIEEFEALQSLKQEAIALDIDPSDDVSFLELIALVSEKKKDLEALQGLKEEALALDIDPSDDISFEELTLLVNEKKDMTA